MSSIVFEGNRLFWRGEGFEVEYRRPRARGVGISPAHSQNICCVGESADKNLIVSVDCTGDICVWNRRASADLWRIGCLPQAEGQKPRLITVNDEGNMIGIAYGLRVESLMYQLAFVPASTVRLDMPPSHLRWEKDDIHHVLWATVGGAERELHRIINQYL